MLASWGFAILKLCAGKMYIERISYETETLLTHHNLIRTQNTKKKTSQKSLHNSNINRYKLNLVRTFLGVFAWIFKIDSPTGRADLSSPFAL